MIEFFLLIFALCAALIGIVVAIPFFVNFNHTIENDENHLYNVFMEESGDRGIRVLSAMIVFFPFSGYASLPSEHQYVLFFTFFWLWALYQHTRLFVGVKIFSPRLFSLLVAVIGAHLIISFAERDGYLSATSLTFLTACASLSWGITVCYKRSVQTQHNK